MNPLRDRYVDRDVRDDDSLVTVAEDYVQRYTGEFSFLLECRDRLAAGLGLTVGQVRGILNCMRSDPRVGHLPVPARPSVTEPSDAKIIQLPVRRTPERRRPHPYMDLPAWWKCEFGVSTHKQARAVHRVHRESGIRYYLHATQLPFHERFSLQLRWVCSANFPREFELLDAETADKVASWPGWKHCRQCSLRPEYWLVLKGD